MALNINPNFVLPQVEALVSELEVTAFEFLTKQGLVKSEQKRPKLAHRVFTSCDPALNLARLSSTVHLFTQWFLPGVE